MSDLTNVAKSGNIPTYNDLIRLIPIRRQVDTLTRFMIPRVSVRAGRLFLS
jgi:hypothetical protein